jgi:PAS domain S-box-containing protein
MIDNEIRLQAVERFKTLNIESDAEFQELIQMASETCNTPIALLTLVDKDTQYFRVRKGTDVTDLPREYSFCTYTIQEDAVLVIPDTTEDERFAHYPTVANDPNVRFYAGAPLITIDGQRIGSLCVIGLEPHQLNQQQELMLKMLSKQAINIMEFRISVEMLEQNKIEVEQHKEIIKRAEIRLRSFFESSHNFHVLLGKNGEIIDFNKVAFKFVKKIYNKKLSRGNMFTSFLAPDLLNKFTKCYQLALKGVKAFMEGATDYGAHGFMYWEASFETAKDGNGEIVGISYLIRDVTDRKIKELKITDQNRSLLKIAHMQAHEFRAPLTTVIGLLDLMKEESYQISQEYFEMLRIAADNLDQKIHEVINNVDQMALINNTEVHSV